MMELKEENVKDHLLRKQRITMFLKTRNIRSEDEQIQIVKLYAKTIRSNVRVYKIYKTICTSNITFNIFKKWVDKNTKHVKKPNP